MNDSFSGVGGVGQRTVRITRPLEGYGADRMARAAADDSTGSAPPYPVRLPRRRAVFVSDSPMDDLGA